MLKNEKGTVIVVFGLPVSQLAFFGQKIPKPGRRATCVIQSAQLKPGIETVHKDCGMSEVWDKAKILTVTSHLIINKITRLHME